MTTPEAEWPTRMMVCVGLAFMEKGPRVGTEWVEITQKQFDESETIPLDWDDSVAGSTRIYNSAQFKRNYGQRPGLVIEAAYDPDNPGSVYMGGKHIGLWKNLTQLATWQANADAMLDEDELGKQSTKDRRHDEMLECLLPIRHAHMRCSSTRQRTLLIARVIQRIQTPLSAKQIDDMHKQTK